MSYSPNIPRASTSRSTASSADHPRSAATASATHKTAGMEHHITIAEPKTLKVRPSIDVASSGRRKLHPGCAHASDPTSTFRRDRAQNRSPPGSLRPATASINVKHVKFEHFRKEELVIDQRQ